MRRTDREVTDFNKIIEIINRCDVCRIALNGDDGTPYIIPLNFGFAADSANGNITFFFHSALEGKKHTLISRCNKAAFELDCSHSIESDEVRGYCTMRYESVIGQGVIEYITDRQEKIDALTILTDKYHPHHFEFSHNAIDRTSVYRLSVTNISAKRNILPKK